MDVIDYLDTIKSVSSLLSRLNVIEDKYTKLVHSLWSLDDDLSDIALNMTLHLFKEKDRIESRSTTFKIESHRTGVLYCIVVDFLDDLSGNYKKFGGMTSKSRYSVLVQEIAVEFEVIEDTIGLAEKNKSDPYGGMAFQ